ncbi:helix-turn-helix domain-containing protein [Saliphagus sp. LR7]|uniref:helix-turn-helix domain-containing protein n=1 Tax=Saliphagus sp. LR7 TaxID=2282654 RepID=UPI000DF8328D|nr:helix-turn-helix domain-containing protein [Saliphagus sp. LR7]
MATIVEFTIPAEEFALSRTLLELPEMVFQIDRVVAHDTDHLMPFVWASNGDFEGLTSVLEDDPTVTEVDHLMSLEDQRFYRMEWTDEAQLVGNMVIEQGGTVQQATAFDDRWHLRVFFPERNHISAAYEHAENNGLQFDVTRIYDMSNIQQARFGLTEEQFEVLRMAVEHGYFDIPRQIPQEQLAEKLNISHQAVSERLRRAIKGLAENAVCTEGGETSPTGNECKIS